MYRIRCQSKTEPGLYRHIQVNGDAICCGGDIVTQDDSARISMLSSLTASGQWFILMIGPSRWAQAHFKDGAIPSTGRKLRRDRRWRGLAVQEQDGTAPLRRSLPTDKPEYVSRDPSTNVEKIS